MTSGERFRKNPIGDLLGQTAKEKLQRKTAKKNYQPAGRSPKPAAQSPNQTKGRRLRTDPWVKVLKLAAAALKPPAAGWYFFFAVFRLQLFPGQNLLEQIQRSRIAGLTKPEHCLPS